MRVFYFNKIFINKNIIMNIKEIKFLMERIESNKRLTDTEYRQKHQVLLKEDNLEVKSIAKQIYSFLTKNGVKTEIVAGMANNRSTSIGDSELSAKSGENTALITYYDDPKTKQTVIYIRLNGEEQSLLQVEKKIGQSFSNLEQYDRKILNQDSTNYRMEFKVKEKTTAKGGLVGNTNKPKQKGQ